MAHLIETLLFPPVGNLLLALVGLYWLKRSRRRAGLLCLWAGLGSLFLLCLPIVAAALLTSLQTCPPLRPTEPLPEADAIVILGADFQSAAPEMGRATASPLTLVRLRYGAKLARRSSLPILVSGGSLGPKEPPLARIMARILDEELGTPVRWEENRSLSTRQNAERSTQILTKAGCKRILLVTHAWHMPRAKRAFEHAGLEVIPAPTAFHPWPAREIGAITPFARSLQESTWGLHEWVGTLWYSLTESSHASQRP